MCYYRTDDGMCRKFTDDKYTSYCVDGPCPDDTPTNADKIRGMSDEELAAERIEFSYNPNGPDSYIGDFGSVRISGSERKEAYQEALQKELDWLQQPAETEGTK